jgi:hypothetical protein
MGTFRVLLIWLLSVVGLAGCDAPAATLPTPVSGPSAFSIAVASNDFGTGAPRVPFIVFRGSQRLAAVQSIRIAAFDLRSGTPVPGWSGDATSYSDYEIPYWVVYPQVPSAGYWGLLGDVTLPDGTRSQVQFTIEVTSTVSAPDIGQIPPASHNRTLATEHDLTKLTSDAAPEPGLYQLTVADALKSGKPTVVTFATPAFCQSRLCAPVVNSVKAVYHEFKDQVNFIHIEVYKTFNPLVYADEMDEWHLVSEPWTFVLDKTGKVAARLGGPVSPRELTAALTPLLKP